MPMKERGFGLIAYIIYLFGECFGWIQYYYLSWGCNFCILCCAFVLALFVRAAVSHSRPRF